MNDPGRVQAEFLRTLSVLYVEDDALVRSQLAHFLERRVKQLTVAENGREGLEAFHSGKYDIVVTDIKMPEMDGLQMAEKIKADSRDVPIIVITAYSDRDYLLRAIELGVNRYVTKPIDPDALVEAIYRAVEDDAGGIPTDVLPRIFEPYYTTKEEGSGIGLYMAKTIIEKNMHGTIEAGNTDTGARFVLSIPLKAPAGAQHE